MTEKGTDQKPGPTKSKLYEAQTQIHNIAETAEEKRPLLQAISEEILKQESKLENLRDLQATYLKLALEIVEQTRQQLDAIVAD